MSEQGRSDLSSEVNERTLDRIAGLEKLIAPELVKQALAATGKQVTRECRLNNEVMTWVVLSMGLFTELPIRQVFKACRRLRRGERSRPDRACVLHGSDSGANRLPRCTNLSCGPSQRPTLPVRFIAACVKWESTVPSLMFPTAIAINTGDVPPAVVAKERSRRFVKSA